MIELSVVLVIIGLMVGGVLAGRTLIRSTEMRTITIQREAFVTASQAFKQKYNALPGDMTNVEDHWGIAADCSVSQTTIATCNGNGNGVINNFLSATTTGNESFLFWKHLANAGLLAGKFIGKEDGASQFATTARNAPGGKIANSLWYAGSWGIVSGAVYDFDGVYNNCFIFAGQSNNNAPAGLIISPKEAFELDSKMDDGKPGTGIFRARIAGSCSVKADGVTPAVDSDSLTAIYNRALSTYQCNLIFPNVVY